MFLHTKTKDVQHSRHKHASIAEDPCLVEQTNEKSKTVVIDYVDKTIENVSISRVLRAPRRRNPAELQNFVQPTITEATFVDYPLNKFSNIFHAPTAEDIYQPKVDELGTRKSAQESVEDDKLVRMKSKKELRTYDVTTENEFKVKPDDFSSTI